MTGKTHIAGGAAAGACIGFALHLPINQLLACCAAGGIGGLIPDLDASRSIITSHTGIVGATVSHVTRHRGIMHTPIVYVVLNYILWLMMFRSAPISHPGTLVLCGLFSGEISHLILDSLNHVGIMWLWPYPKRFSVLHVSSHGILNTMLRYLFIAICACIVIWSYYH